MVNDLPGETVPQQVPIHQGSKTGAREEGYQITVTPPVQTRWCSWNTDLAFTTRNSLTALAEATALLFIQQHVKSAIVVDHVTPPHGQIWPLHRMIVRELRQ